MNRYRLVIAYDGTDFHGWQSQIHKKTIQDTLIKAFDIAFSKKAAILGASRTDAGVHAMHQIALLTTDLDFSNPIMLRAWNSILPPSIVIRSLEVAPDNFHPLRTPCKKTYTYTLFLKRPLPFDARFGWFYSFIQDVDIAKLKEALNLYIGTHDFRSFCRLDEEKDTTRTIDSLTLEEHSDKIIITISGPGFLRFQIRRMIGYALDVARRKNLTVSDLARILNNPSPHQHLTKAEPSGLCLKEIRYEE
jgi:tRNA pseudouridine38-40 synthase